MKQVNKNQITVYLIGKREVGIVTLPDDSHLALEKKRGQWVIIAETDTFDHAAWKILDHISVASYDSDFPSTIA